MKIEYKPINNWYKDLVKGKMYRIISYITHQYYSAMYTGEVREIELGPGIIVWRYGFLLDKQIKSFDENSTWGVEELVEVHED